MRRKNMFVLFAVVMSSTLVSPDLPQAAEADQHPATGAFEGWVSDIRAYAPSGQEAVCNATISEGKLGAGKQLLVYATAPLLQAALISAAQRQVLVSVQYKVPSPDADSLTAQVISVQLLDQPIYLRARALAKHPPKAIRVIDGVKSTFPEKSLKAGALRALSALESCTSSDRPGADPPTIEDLAAAKKSDHVRFVFSLPIKVELLDDRIEVAELVFSEKTGFLVRDDDDNVFYGTKYRHAPMDDFQKWYRQVLPAD